MPFDVCPATAALQRLMDSVLDGLKWRTCLVYLDVVICFSPNFDQHPKDLKETLLRLCATSLKNKLSKRAFASNSIPFLEHTLSPDSLHTDPEKIRTVAQFPVPTTTEALRSFLGLAGYYRSFISKVSVITALLNALLKKNAVWTWSESQQSAYGTLKSALLVASVLQFPNFSRHFEKHTNGTCSTGIDIILC
jgi:uncharacterized membrane protein YqhA